MNLERWYNNASSITSDGGGGWARCLVPGCEHWGDRDTPYLDTELTAAFRCHRDVRTLPAFVNERLLTMNKEITSHEECGCSRAAYRQSMR